MAATGEVSRDIEGPDWVTHGLDVRAGRFPLAVEAHLLNMTARLVPGATTVTTVARSYSLHAAIAIEAEQRGLDDDAAAELLRRSEVVVAGVSIANDSSGNTQPHGNDRVQHALRTDGLLDVDRLAQPVSGYANSNWGFLGPYLGSELSLGILADNGLHPGHRIDREAVAGSFDGLFDVARQSTVTLTELKGNKSLAISAVRDSSDGEWLRRLFTGTGVEQPLKRDAVRRATIVMLCRSIQLTEAKAPLSAFREAIAFGDLARTDATLATIDETAPWRGVLFRHESVGAWRRIWAWLVSSMKGLTSIQELADAMAAAMPKTTLGAFLASLPDTVGTDGEPVDAESAVREAAWSIPTESLALIALGARRSSELTEAARAALVGDESRVAVLSPIWVDRWLKERTNQSLQAVAAELVSVLLDRSQRIAQRKMRIGTDGRIWLPTRVHEHGGLFYKIGDEGSGNVGLRIDQLASLLKQLGLLQQDPRGWTVAEPALNLLELPTK